MQADPGGLDPPRCDIVEHALREMQTGRRGRYGAPQAGIKGLVAFQVDGLGIAVQIGRNGHASAEFEHPREGRSALPGEFHHAGLAVAVDQARLEADLPEFIIGGIQVQDIVLPAFGVADDAFPAAALRGRETDVVFRGIIRLEAEDFDVRSRGTAEKQAGRDHFGVVEDHQAARRQFLGEIAEFARTDESVAVNQQFRRIALRKRIFGNALVRERIIKILDMDLRNHRTKLMLFYCTDKVLRV